MHIKVLTLEYFFSDSVLDSFVCSGWGVVHKMYEMPGDHCRYELTFDLDDGIVYGFKTKV